MLAALLLAAFALGPGAPGQCFLTSQYRSWRDEDARALLVRFNVRDVYRLTTAAACPQLKAANAQLVLNTDGDGQICSAADWDLRVRLGVGGLDTPVVCRVATMTRLTPAQVEALPAARRPD